VRKIWRNCSKAWEVRCERELHSGTARSAARRSIRTIQAYRSHIPGLGIDSIHRLRSSEGEDLVSFSWLVIH
jgi:hypothetical protein